MGRHQYTASVPKSTQHQHQQVHNFNTQLQYQKGMCLKNRGCHQYAAILKGMRGGGQLRKRSPEGHGGGTNSDQRCFKHSFSSKSMCAPCKVIVEEGNPNRGVSGITSYTYIYMYINTHTVRAVGTGWVGVWVYFKRLYLDKLNC